MGKKKKCMCERERENGLMNHAKKTVDATTMTVLQIVKKILKDALAYTHVDTGDRRCLKWQISPSFA